MAAHWRFLWRSPAEAGAPFFPSMPKGVLLLSSRWTAGLTRRLLYMRVLAWESSTNSKKFCKKKNRCAFETKREVWFILEVRCVCPESYNVSFHSEVKKKRIHPKDLSGLFSPSKMQQPSAGWSVALAAALLFLTVANPASANRQGKLYWKPNPLRINRFIWHCFRTWITAISERWWSILSPYHGWLCFWHVDQLPHSVTQGDQMVDAIPSSFFHYSSLFYLLFQ